MFKRKIKRRSVFVIVSLIVNACTFITLVTYNFETDPAEKDNAVVSYKRFYREDFQTVTSYNDSSLGIDIQIFAHPHFGIIDVHGQRINIHDVKKFLKDNEPLTSTKYKDVYIFSSVIRRSGENISDGVTVNLWETSLFKNRRGFCCLLSENGRVSKVPVSRKSSFLNNTLTSVQVMCKVSNYIHKPVAVTLIYENHDCPVSEEFYVKTVTATQCSDKVCFAICAKIAYDSVNPEILIEWMEYYRRMGVNYVVVFIYNLTSTSLDVLKLYQNEGWVEVLPFDYPSKDSPVHKPGDKTIPSWSDEQLTVYNCHARLNRFRFVGVIDLDEFLVPKRGNLQDLLMRLSKQHPKAASFAFMTEIHAFEWGRDTTKNSSSSLIPKYTKHTKALKDRNKVVHLPSLVESGGVATHGVIPKQGYERVVVLPQQATLHHYRQCRKEWIQDGTCYNQTLQTSARVAEILKTVDDRVVAVKRLILP